MPTVNSPDAALLVLSGELRVLQGEWQHLCEATPEVSDAGPVGISLDNYSENFCPGDCRLDAFREPDPVRGLITMQANKLAARCTAPSDIRDQLCPCTLWVNTLLIDTHQKYPGCSRVFCTAEGQNRPFFLR